MSSRLRRGLKPSCAVEEVCKDVQEREPKMKRQRVEVRLDSATRRKIEEVAAARGRRSLSWYAS